MKHKLVITINITTRAGAMVPIAVSANQELARTVVHAIRDEMLELAAKTADGVIRDLADTESERLLKLIQKGFVGQNPV
jgi:hypothetical protein